MSPNPIIAMAPTNVQTSAVQGSPANLNQQQQTRHNMQVNGGSPRHRKNKKQRERNTPSPKHRGSPKPKTSIPSSSRRNYTPPPRFQKLGQVDNSNNFSSNFYLTSDNSMSMSSDENSNDSTKDNYAGAKFHSEAPRPEDLPLPPKNWLVGCFNQATSDSKPDPVQISDYHEQLSNELKSMLKVAM